MGEVYRARHVHLDEIRIIKVTKPDAAGEGPEPRRFQEEARIATLVRHPNVAALYDFSRLPDGSFYMVWEFIDGVTLEQWLRRHGADARPRARSTSREQVLAGLAEIHAQGIVHRDLAPDNIMLREGPGGTAPGQDHRPRHRQARRRRNPADDGHGHVRREAQVLLAGAGRRASPRRERSTRAATSTRSASSSTRCSPDSRPSRPQTPEGYLGKHLHAPAPPLDTTRLPAAVGPRLAAILKRALEKNRDRRFANADEFRGRDRGARPAAESPEPEAAGADGPTPRLRCAAAVAFALVLAAAIAAYAVIHRPTRPRGPRRPTTVASRRRPSRRPAPTAAMSPAVEASPGAAAPPEAGRSAPVRASSRSVADAIEAEPSRPAPTAAPRPTRRPRSPRHPRKRRMSRPCPPRWIPKGRGGSASAYAHWPELPVERQAAQARVARARGESLRRDLSGRPALGASCASSGFRGRSGGAPSRSSTRVADASPCASTTPTGSSTSRPATRRSTGRFDVASRRLPAVPRRRPERHGGARRVLARSSRRSRSDPSSPRSESSPRTLYIGTGRREALERVVAQARHLEAVAHRLVGRRPDHDVSRRRDELLHAGGDVDRVAEHRVVHAPLRADLADDRLAGVDRDADLDRRLARASAAPVPGSTLVADLQRRRDGALGVVRLVDRRAEERHRRVADELVDRAVLRKDRVRAEREEARQQRGERLRAPSSRTSDVNPTRSANRIVTCLRPRRP